MDTHTHARAHTHTQGNDALMVLMGTKLDVVMTTPSLCQVPIDEARSLATHKHMLDPIETSAKNNTNIDQTFIHLAKSLRKKHEGLSDISEQEQSIHLTTTDIKGTGKESQNCPC